VALSREGRNDAFVAADAEFEVDDEFAVGEFALKSELRAAVDLTGERIGRGGGRGGCR